MSPSFLPTHFGEDPGIQMLPAGLLAGCRKVTRRVIRQPGS